jgi:2-succinyl-6-hydroxy-2,4-cyclohexadiene-1-carboxylate synthase
VPAERLAATSRGGGPRLVLVHGFTQTSRSWDDVAEHLADDHEVVAVDAPGHGGSAAIATDLPGGAALLGATGGRATYVGYSMGGRLCLHLALARPDLVERLVLVSTTAGIDDDAERAARRAADEALAASLEGDGLEPFLRRWVSQPLFAGLPDPGLDDRRRNTVTGLASSLRLAGTGTQRPLWHELRDLDRPVLLVAGRRDTKFVAATERMAARLPDSTVALVDGAGHTVHLERPAAFREVLALWLAATPTDDHTRP